MAYVPICERCQKTYQPIVTVNTKRLRTFKGYTVDLRLQQFRKIKYGKLPQYIEFDSAKGKRLLAHMHEEATR